ncbi:hypothetical protein QBC40DRAFT_177969 [Triangularia verruculosa]|uniref:Uncharacterized protein n=1 Tax=Triangularia verruculosa TaxID=2587418 RepID=A0AAN7AVB4_9PEZI|nr:hypothetical protein QBC40DRAFT_177969 [Triangularia verruculosa]
MPQGTSKPTYSQLEAALVQERQARTRAEQRLHELTRDHRFNNRVYSANRLVLELQDAQRYRDGYKEQLDAEKQSAQYWKGRTSELERLDVEISERCKLEKGSANNALKVARRDVDHLQRSLAAAEVRHKETERRLREERDSARRQLEKVLGNHYDEDSEDGRSVSNVKMLEPPETTFPLPSPRDMEVMTMPKQPTLHRKKRFAPTRS